MKSNLKAVCAILCMTMLASARSAPTSGVVEKPFMAPGAGAVPRSFADKASVALSVKDYGAKADGTTNDAPAVQKAIEAVKGTKTSGTVAVPNGNYAGAQTVTVKGNFNGGVAVEGSAAKLTTSQDGAALTIGEYATPAPEFRLNARVRGVNLTGPGKTSLHSIGAAINDTADVFLSDGTISGYAFAVKSTGGLIYDINRMTLRDSAYGLHATSTAKFAPNSLNLTGLRIIKNDKAVYTDNNPNGTVNFIGSEIEGNNAGGTDLDGKRVIEHLRAGNVNYVGVHFESNPGQYNLYYNGNDSTKNLLIAGSQVIAGAAEQVHVAQGRFTGIASRITAGGKRGIVFGATASGTLIDVEGDINGTVSGVAALRQGRLGFGVQPVAGDPLINASESSIAASSNIVTNYRSDIVQHRYQNKAGTRIAYVEYKNNADAIFHQDQAYGWKFDANNTGVLYIGRSGTVSIEPVTTNTGSNGTSSLRWANTYSTNFRPGTGAPLWTSGKGSPEGVVTASVGSLYTRTDGGAGTTLYVKESGAGNTGWIAK